jgi:predicted metalloendopeptidase
MRFAFLPLAAALSCATADLAAQGVHWRWSANIRAEFRSRLGNVTWMSQETKSKAYAKLDSIINKIGYPDRLCKGLNIR